MNRLEILEEVYGKCEWSESALKNLLRVMELTREDERIHQINLAEQHDMRLGQVPQDAHAFYVNNLAPVKVVLPDFWNKD